jgi:hypothetical protein
MSRRVLTLLRAHRAKNESVDDELANNVPYDAVHERLRRKQLGLLLSRTRDEAEEEEFVVATMKRFNQVRKYLGRIMRCCYLGAIFWQ